MKQWADYGIEVTGSGREVYTTCPQCSPHRKKKKVKCLSVNTDKQVWICHHCDWRGTLKGGPENKSNPNAWRKPEYVKPQWQSPTGLDEKVVNWFKSRGISEAILQRNDIGYGLVYMPQVEDHVNAIQFPFKRNGEVVNIKYRDGQKNFRMVGGAQRVFYGMEDMQDETIIVEGEMDKLSVEVAGFQNCVSVPDGAPSVESKDYSAKFEFLDACQEELSKVKRFILAVDSDAPGQKLQEELGRRLGWERCSRVMWHEGCKDANEVLVKMGAESLAEYIKSAQPFPIEGVVTAYDVSDRIINLYNNGLKPGNNPGWEGLKELYTVREGEWTLVTGIPGHGKSEFIDALMINLAKDHGWHFAIYSPENHPVERHIVKLCEKFSGKPFRSGYSDRLQSEDLAHAISWVNHHFNFIAAEEDSPKLEYVLEKAKQLVFRKGIKGLVIDPWNELDHERPGNLSETEYISKCLTTVRTFARYYGVHIWLVAHPTKLIKDKDGVYPVPTPYDVSGSAHWRNKADNAIAVWRDVKITHENIAVHVQKIRFKEVGRIGMCKFTYQPSSGRLIEGSTVQFF